MPLRTSFSEMNCSLARALEQVGDPWSMLIVRECALGACRFETFRAALGIARNILAQRLRALVGHGLLEKSVDRDDARGTAYALTRKGHEVLPALIALMQWGDRWVSGKGNEPVRLESDGGRRLARVILMDANGRKVDPTAVRFRAGPGAKAATRIHLGRVHRTR